MSDLYTEVLVKKQQTGKDKAIKGVLIFFTVLFAAAGIMTKQILILDAFFRNTFWFVTMINLVLLSDSSLISLARISSP